LVATVLVYLPAIDGGFYFDDVNNFVDPPSFHWTEMSWSGVRDVITMTTHPGRPLPNLSLAANHAFGGLAPKGYHVVNVIIHLLVGLALYWVCLEYDRSSRPGGKGLSGPAPVAAIVASLFLLHPLNTQAVSYVVQRMTSMAALFVLIAFGCYLVARRGRGSVKGRLGWVIAAAVSGLAGVLSKENALGLPAVIVLYEIAFHCEEWRSVTRQALTTARGRRRVVAVVVVIGSCVACLAWFYVPWGLLTSFDPMSGREYSWPERVLTQPRVHLLYLSLLAWPAPSRLNLDHDVAISRSFLDPATTAPALVVVGLAVLGATLLVKRRPRWGFPLLAYFVYHAIESGPVNLELAFEHRMYLPLTMLAVFAVVALVDAPRPVQRAAWVVVPIAALALGAATYQRNLVWADPIAFHYDCAEKSPNKFRPQYNLGTELGKIGRRDEAEQVLLRALALDPQDSETNNQLGNILFHREDLNGALKRYRRAVELEPGNIEAMYNVALASELLDDLDAALVYYRRFVDAAQGIPWLTAARQQVLSRLPVLAAQAKSQESENGTTSQNPGAE